MVLHCRALLSDDESEAEGLFASALAAHADAARPFERARCELAYGEFLRRARRRVEAREHLRAALDTFETLGAALWAERARVELRVPNLGPATRRTRILDEALDHLHSSANELEQQGMSRHEAEAKAVAQLGDPRRFAREFSPPARRDWLVDATAWWSSRAAAALLGLGALMVLIEALAWSIGVGTVSAQTVRVWRTCRQSVNGECVGGWNETHAPTLVALGAICLVAGVVVLAVHWLLRRRYSDLELMPRLLDVGTQVSLGTVGAVLLIGGATRSSLDASWRWVPLWLPVGLACIGAAFLLHRSAGRRGAVTVRRTASSPH